MSSLPDSAEPTHQRRMSPHHDVLITNPKGELYQIPVEKRRDHPQEGQYLEKPVARYYAEPGHRKVTHGLDRQSETPDPELARGIAFGTLPVKPEPATSFFSCYRINAENLRYITPWTAPDWNDKPGSDDANSADYGVFKNDKLEALLAGPGGRVFHVAIDLDRGPVQLKHEGVTVSELNLRHETEIWGMLRNGCVAGTAFVEKEQAIVPLVNIASLIPRQDSGKTLVEKQQEEKQS